MSQGKDDGKWNGNLGYIVVIGIILTIQSKRASDFLQTLPCRSR